MLLSTNFQRWAVVLFRKIPGGLLPGLHYTMYLYTYIKIVHTQYLEAPKSSKRSICMVI